MHLYTIRLGSERAPRLLYFQAGSILGADDFAAKVREAAQAVLDSPFGQKSMEANSEGGVLIFRPGVLEFFTEAMRSRGFQPLSPAGDFVMEPFLEDVAAPGTVLPEGLSLSL